MRPITRAALLSVALALGVITAQGHASATTFIPFKSAQLPYSIGYPSGWRHETFAFGQLKADAFLRPTSSKGFADNINIIRTATPASIASDADLLRANQEQIKTGLKSATRRIGTVVVAGHHLTVLAWTEYSQTGQKLIVTQAFLYMKGNAWNFTLTTALGDNVKLRPLFKAMLGTFHSH